MIVLKIFPTAITNHATSPHDSHIAYFFLLPILDYFNHIANKQINPNSNTCRIENPHPQRIPNRTPQVQKRNPDCQTDMGLWSLLRPLGYPIWPIYICTRQGLQHRRARQWCSSIPQFGTIKDVLCSILPWGCQSDEIDCSVNVSSSGGSECGTISFTSQ